MVSMEHSWWREPVSTNLGVEDMGWEWGGGGVAGMTEGVVLMVTSGPSEKLWEEGTWWDNQVWNWYHLGHMWNWCLYA